MDRVNNNDSQREKEMKISNIETAKALDIAVEKIKNNELLDPVCWITYLLECLEEKYPTICQDTKRAVNERIKIGSW